MKSPILAGLFWVVGAASFASIVTVNNGQTLNLSMEKTDQGYAYNGTIPGPTIQVQQGSAIRVVLANHTDLDTTLHPHGVRLDNPFDGIPGITQQPIRPGETFTYQIKFPDAGIYWYHPHIKDWYARSRGAYGVFLVAPKNIADFNQVNREEVLILSDIDIVNGKVVEEDPNNPTHVLMGKFGNTMLINGQSNFKLNIKKGEVVRFYILNAADVRPFNFQISGTKMKIIGGDIGKSVREAWATSVLIGPAERYMVEVLFTQPGQYQITNAKPGQVVPLGLIQVSDLAPEISYEADFSGLKEDSSMKADIEKYRKYFSKPIDKKLVMTMDMKMDMGGGHTMALTGAASLPLWNRMNGVEWEDSMPGMNAGSTLETVTWKLVDPVGNKTNMDILWEFDANTPVKIELYNDPQSMHAMQHPIHFHGQRFLVLSVNGQENPILQWKDTVLVRPGERMQILLDASNPGNWMFHCHISRHAVQQGKMQTMMGRFRVKQSGVEASPPTSKASESPAVLKE